MDRRAVPVAVYRAVRRVSDRPAGVDRRSQLFSESSGWGWGNYVDILTSPFYLQAFQFSLEISLWSSAYGLLIALVGSYSLRQLGQTRFHDFVMSFTNMTSNFAGVPLAFAFVILLGLNGCLTLLLRKYGLMESFNLYSKSGLIVLYTYFQIPLGVLLLYPAFDALRADWRESAALLGAGPWRYWRHIGLPVLAPALMGTFVILLANALGAYATVYALTTGNFNVIPIRISALVAGTSPRSEPGQRAGDAAGGDDGVYHGDPPMDAAQELP